MTSGKHIKLALSETDLVLLNNALNEILNGPDAIAEWEFQPVPVPSEAKQSGCFGASVTQSTGTLRNEYRAAPLTLQPTHYSELRPLSRSAELER